MNISIPKLSLVVLIGPSGSGKSTFARQHFLSTEVLSSDFCRGLVSDDENDQSATTEAFDVLHYVAGKRLAAGRLPVVDPSVPQAGSAQLADLQKGIDKMGTCNENRDFLNGCSFVQTIAGFRNDTR